jgi:hypothetical protein
MTKRTETVQFWLSEDDLILLRQLADHLETTMSHVVELALQRAIDENEVDAK